ncbi:sensor histidine kinase [Anaerostipes faecalis]|uniref:sensor histidine kinase n=1 Tax=Anaerostipes TaxID=207244 RepID=UPI0009516929|nr:two-component sensor histidine kinase [Anaerostipes sp. 494a]
MQFIVLIAVFSLSVFISLLFSKFLNDGYSEKVLDQKIDHIENQCKWLGNQVVGVDFILDGSSNSLSTQTDQLAASMNGRIIVIKSNYKIIKDTHTDFQDRYFLNKDILKIMDGKKKRIVREKGDYAEVMVPIVSEAEGRDDVLGAVICTVPQKDIMAAISDMSERRNMLLVAFIIFGLSFSVVLSYLLTRDFRKIQKDVDYIAAGHEDASVGESGFTEVQEIVHRFNEILSRMQTLEDSRQEFVSNVSHELKTPMTSMKVLADSLLQQGDQVPVELYREFMEDIVAEIDRENVIISDLLSLVKMDKKAAKLEISNVNINELLEIIMKRLKPIAKQRNIELIFESFRPVTAEIDEVKLTLALSNIIENGIKYNKDDGWIRVTLNADHKYFYVKVADSGVGIPEDCQDKVFDRFFRVDKARSRDTGGTGLGLAIAHNAVLMHNGEIKLYSKVGEGTTFTFRIPLKYNV